MSTTRAVSVALWTQDSAQHPEMMCAYRTPDQSYCKFNTNYSNNILITWGEVKNNAVIPPEHGAGPSPLRAGHFQLLCQLCVVMAESTQQSKVPGKLWLQPLIHLSWLCPGKGGTKPSLAVSAAAWQSDPLLHSAWVQPKEALWLGSAAIQGCPDHCMSSASWAGWSPTLERTMWLRKKCPFEGAV